MVAFLQPEKKYLSQGNAGPKEQRELLATELRMRLCLVTSDRDGFMP
jgi:hypothetical protein